MSEDPQMKQAMQWQRNKRFYEKAIEDLTYLTRFPPKGIFSPEAALDVFSKDYEYSIENMAGDPDLVYQEMCKHARSVVDTLSTNAAYDVALRKATDESGKLLLTRSNYNPSTREINIYTYDPFKPAFSKERKVREKSFKYPKKTWEALMDNKIAYRMEVDRLIADQGWLDDSLDETELVDGRTLWTDMQYDPVTKMRTLKAIYEPNLVVEEITQTYKDRYSNCEAKADV